MTKQAFDQQLKNDAKENRFTIEGDFIVFNSKSNLDYKIIPHFDLRELLTKNPISSYTKLSKNLLLWLYKIRVRYGKPISANSFFRSFEYNLTVPGSAKDSFHCKGLAGDLGVPDPEYLKQCIEELGFIGQVGIYDTFVHIAVTSENVRWDNRKKKSLANYLNSDKKRNLALLALVGICLFLIKKL